MRNWRKQREAPPSVQLRSGERHPFGVLREYVPLGRGEARLYRAVREAVPGGGRRDLQTYPHGGRGDGPLQ